MSTTNRGPMHAMVFRVTIHEPEEAARLLQEEMVPGMARSPGFVAGYWVQTAENHGTSVIFFESEEALMRTAQSAPRPQSKALTVESFETGAIVAHA